MRFSQGIKKILSTSASRSFDLRPLSTTSTNLVDNLSNFGSKNIVLVDGVRTPFLVSGTGYSNVLPHELARHTIVSLLSKANVDKDLIEYLVYGIVLQEVQTSNVAREAALSAGLKYSTPAHTVTMACISSNQAMTTGIGLIASGSYNIVIAGGVEVISNFPLRYSKRMRQIMFRSLKAKTFQQKLQLLLSIRPDFFIPEKPSLVEFSSNESLGHSADRLAAAFQVSRQEQDEYALRSHTLAKQAQDKGFLTDLVSYKALEIEEMVSKDNGIRVSTIEQLSQLPLAFIRSFGTVTAGNASFLTDGASACLIMSEAKAKELGLKPKAYLRGFTYVSQDPVDQLLLGPAYAIPKVLRKACLKMTDIDVWEVHEAFAGQVLANLKALDSDWFCSTFLNLHKKFGIPDMNKWNQWGGSLSIGHPFAATGVRLAMHTANRLIREDGQFGVIAACASGGLGVAMLLERCPDATAD